MAIVVNGRPDRPGSGLDEDEKGLQIVNTPGGPQKMAIINESGLPEWIAKDICGVLEHSDVSMALRRLDEDEKGARIVCTRGGPQKMATVNESGLFKLIMTSRKPQARLFRKWITSVVLPSIRKTGSFAIEPTAPYPSAAGSPRTPR